MTNPSEVDDIVQETVTRLLARRLQLDESASVGYAFVVARNLVHSAGRRRTRERRHQHLLHQPGEPARPDGLAVRAEERAALHEALRHLPEQQRSELLDHVLRNVPLAALAEDGNTAGVAARLARTRARMRVDYLLSLRRVELPSDRCRPVLLSLSAGDRRRQRVLRSGNHLLACDACADLAPPLLQRNHKLAGFIPFLPLGSLHGRLARRARNGPTQVVAACAAVAAVAATAAVILIPSSEPTRPPADLRGPRGALLAMRADLSSVVGQPARAQEVPVLAVAADEGFWVGHGQARLWVQMTGPGESTQRVRVGDRLSFLGTVARHGSQFAQRVGVEADEGAGELTRQRFHIEVSATRIHVTR